MSTTTPLQLVDDLMHDAETGYLGWENDRYVGRPGTEGYGKYCSLYENDNDSVAGLIFVCPGCRALSSILFVSIDKHPVWSWNGSKTRPTCTPSILHNKDKGGCGWHGYLTEGIFVGV